MKDLKNFVISSLENNKAENIVEVDLSGKTDIADYMIIVSGMSSRHNSSLAENLVHDIKNSTWINDCEISIEGTSSGDWVLIDLGDIVVHIFKPEIRQLYNLEKMWSVPSIEAVCIN